MSWGQTLDQQKSALRWDIKRSMNNLCKKLADIGEECFVVTVNVSNGWVGHMGSIRGTEYINQKLFIPYDFLDYCKELEAAALSSEDEISDDCSADDDGGGDGAHGEQTFVNTDPIVEISKYESDSSTDKTEGSQEDGEQTDSTEILLKDTRKEVLYQEKRKIDSHAELPVNSRYPKRQRMQTGSENIHKDNAPVIGARKLSEGGIMMLYCSICGDMHGNRTYFMEHVKSRAHLFKSQDSFRCFKCFRPFVDSVQMYFHMKSCNLLQSVLRLVKTNYTCEETEENSGSGADHEKG